MRTIKKIDDAISEPIADLITFRALPTRSVHHVDPFIFLNHHGYQVYPKNNHGLPFGPHPHRGFETVTFILQGDLAHKDSSGAESVIDAGGVQWMTAGRGLIHSEVSSKEFIKNGGSLEILQLWVNLPVKYKMTDPKYTGLQKGDIPNIILDNGNVVIDAVSGTWEGITGAFKTLADIRLATIHFKQGGTYKTAISSERNIFFYLVKGKVNVNGKDVKMHQLAEFNNDGEEVNIAALEDSLILFGHAVPFNEPIIARGPFVMNSEDEIKEAYDDYRNGKFGSWQ